MKRMNNTMIMITTQSEKVNTVHFLFEEDFNNVTLDILGNLDILEQFAERSSERGEVA